MGGRGTFSFRGVTLGGTVHSRNKSKSGLATPDSRTSIRELAHAVGFRDVYNTDDIDERTMQASLEKIGMLESKYRAIGNSLGDVVLNVVIDTGAQAYVTREENLYRQTMNFSIQNMGDSSKLIEAEKRAEKAGWSMKTDGSEKQLLSYVATH